MILGVGWLPHQQSDSVHDVSTPIFDTALVIIIECHIIESVRFPLHESQKICHASHALLDAILILNLGQRGAVLCSCSTLS